MELAEAIERFETACVMDKNIESRQDAKDHQQYQGVCQISDNHYWLRIFKSGNDAGIWIWKVLRKNNIESGAPVENESSPGQRPNLFSHLITIEEFERLKDVYFDGLN